VDNFLIFLKPFDGTLHFPKLNPVLLIVTVLYFSSSLCILHRVTAYTSLNSSSTFLQKIYLRTSYKRSCVLPSTTVLYFPSVLPSVTVMYCPTFPSVLTRIAL
jgi:hypothetical protein